MLPLLFWYVVVLFSIATADRYSSEDELTGSLPTFLLYRHVEVSSSPSAPPKSSSSRHQSNFRLNEQETLVITEEIQAENIEFERAYGLEFGADFGRILEAQVPHPWVYTAWKIDSSQFTSVTHLRLPLSIPLPSIAPIFTVRPDCIATISTSGIWLCIAKTAGDMDGTYTLNAVHPIESEWQLFPDCLRAYYPDFINPCMAVEVCAEITPEQQPGKYLWQARVLMFEEQDDPEYVIETPELYQADVLNFPAFIFTSPEDIHPLVMPKYGLLFLHRDTGAFVQLKNGEEEEFELVVPDIFPPKKRGEKTQQFIVVQRTLYWILLNSAQQIVVRVLEFPPTYQLKFCWIEEIEHPFSTDSKYIPMMELPGYLVDPEAEERQTSSRKRKASYSSTTQREDMQDGKQRRTDGPQPGKQKSTIEETDDTLPQASKRKAVISNGIEIQTQKRVRFTDDTLFEGEEDAAMNLQWT